MRQRRSHSSQKSNSQSSQPIHTSSSQGLRDSGLPASDLDIPKVKDGLKDDELPDLNGKYPDAVFHFDSQETLRSEEGLHNGDSQNSLGSQENDSCPMEEDDEIEKYMGNIDSEKSMKIHDDKHGGSSLDKDKSCVETNRNEKTDSSGNNLSETDCKKTCQTFISAFLHLQHQPHHPNCTRSAPGQSP